MRTSTILSAQHLSFSNSTHSSLSLSQRLISSRGVHLPILQLVALAFRLVILIHSVLTIAIRPYPRAAVDPTTRFATTAAIQHKKVPHTINVDEGYEAWKSNLNWQNRLLISSLMIRLSLARGQASRRPWLQSTAAVWFATSTWVVQSII
jgi:hypothetical protein